MQCYSWRGIRIDGLIRTGIMVKETEHDVEAVLLQNDIALLSCKRMPQWRLWSAPLYRNDILFLFEHLALLLRAGILLPEALSLIALQHKKLRFQCVVHNIAHIIKRGVSCAEAFRRYPSYFDTVVTELIEVGVASGTLGKSLTLITEHLTTMSEHRDRIRSALMKPLIIITLFVCMLCGISWYVLPMFAYLFHQLGIEQLPGLTRSLLRINDMMTREVGLVLLFSCISAVVCLRLWVRTTYRGMLTLDYVRSMIPLWGRLHTMIALFMYMKALEYALSGGMRLYDGMVIARLSLQNSPLLHALCIRLEQAVAKGIPLSMAMENEPDFTYLVSGMIKTGEASGDLTDMLHYAARYYQKKAHVLLHMIEVMIQPTLLVIIGIGIALVMGALYVPLLQLSFSSLH
ncbi:MAG: type II secretion system F family protein [Candidatus Babeliales bacterium]